MRFKNQDNRNMYLEEDVEKLKMSYEIQLSKQKLDYKNQIGEHTKN